MSMHSAKNVQNTPSRHDPKTVITQDFNKRIILNNLKQAQDLQNLENINILNSCEIFTRPQLDR